MYRGTTIRNFLHNVAAGVYDKNDFETQVTAGWFDWFCKESLLAAKTKKLSAKLREIVDSPKIDQDKHYVFFKNNCPYDGDLYDDFRIADVKTGNIVYTVVPATGHNGKKGQAEVWGNENKFKDPIVSGSWNDIKLWFKGE